MCSWLVATDLKSIRLIRLGNVDGIVHSSTIGKFDRLIRGVKKVCMMYDIILTRS